MNERYDENTDYQYEEMTERRALQKAIKAGNLTKAQEIMVLEDAIKKLGKHSYLGPFLTEQVPFLASALHSDMPPNPLSEAHALARSIEHDARVKAQEMIDQAGLTANMTINNARKECGEIKARLRQALADAASKIS
jgi:cell division septum initiation protein DivIVA